MNNADMPAMPTPIAGSTDGCIYDALEYCGQRTGGLTKREYFAAHAPDVPDWFDSHSSKMARIVAWRYAYADAMTKEQGE